MNSQSLATPSQQREVANTLRDTGGKFPDSIINPTVTPHAYQPKISGVLADQIEREAAGDKPQAHAVSEGLKLVGLDAKEVTARVNKLLQDSGSKVTADCLGASTLAALAAVAAQADRIAQRGSR